MGISLTAVPATGETHSSLEGLSAIHLQDYLYRNTRCLLLYSLVSAWALGKEWVRPGLLGWPVEQTGRARLSLNGTLLSLQLCQLGMVGAGKCYFGTSGEGREKALVTVLPPGKGLGMLGLSPPSGPLHSGAVLSLA